ncbi:DNA-binding protein [Pedobacter sp. KBW01]|uniref:helix-turn-helix domain-containing protein n=1 Tax=Pedobacter sp. KBW01 TaxID=2153364 RepID=UPI000F593A31|nr:helix-turn-helix domain-containing protein [Pedobacter sp. KBW01]RQO65481.1 DNA-binding protein [Pedobacter sp. KBW01]
MQIEILTKEELQKFKSELIQEIKQVIKTNETVTSKQWLRSSEVRELLKISPGTLQNLRIKGILRYEKIGGIFYYAYTDINQLMGEIGNL